MDPHPNASPGLTGQPLLRLLQLTSPALPVGAFAYSHGLEQAIHAGWVRTAADAEDWIGGLLTECWARLDVPLLARCYRAAEAGDDAAWLRWSARVRASRESAELLAEDLHLGGALGALLGALEVPGAAAWGAEPRPFAAVLARAAVHWRVPLAETAQGLLWTACEHQVGAAVKAVPLGQTDGQRLLLALAAEIPAAAALGLTLEDDEIGSAAPGLALASAQHETLYTRLFRS